MTVYSIFQLKPEIDRETRLGITCDYYDGPAWRVRVRGAKVRGQYQLVALVNGRDLDHVFEIGNFMEEAPGHLFQEKDVPMHSCSIGDLILNVETKELHVVAVNGFDCLCAAKENV